ncbi:hypothetical protein [Hyphomicrobium sp. DMF-1]|uniref:hypothetical protein n=1 Tax=Hyphomicrobium sp. DMF-1 TaxID=3019544 RepID=UPI0022EBD4A6|nr:hypothetical protein [Hyphomicrobium sp. DMF-1]WBT40169.1 hypothetical protein PE058_09885 [Hyphomicrobium sp. DMF-1]
MTFTASAGRIIATDANGEVKLDTDEDLFHVVTTLPQKSVDIAIVNTSTAFTNLTTEYGIGACDPSCTHVIGAVRFSGSGAWGVAFDRWTTYLGGTIIWAMTAPGLTSQTSGDIYGHVHTFCGYRFFVRNGGVVMERRLVLPSNPPSVGLAIKAHTITCKLKAGRFT